MATSVASATDNDLRFRGAGSSSAPQVVENAPSSGDGEVKSMAESKGFFELLIQSIWEVSPDGVIRSISHRHGHGYGYESSRRADE